MPRFPFAPQVLSITVQAGYQTDHTFGFMRVELVQDENRLFVLVQPLCYPLYEYLKVLLRTGVVHAGAYVSRGDVQSTNQGLCSVADVIAFLASDVMLRRWQVRRRTFQGLHSALLIDAVYADTVVLL